MFTSFVKEETIEQKTNGQSVRISLAGPRLYAPHDEVALLLKLSRGIVILYEFPRKIQV